MTEGPGGVVAEADVKEDDWRKQLLMYLVFAAMMILLNYLIQKINQLFLVILICENFNQIGLINTFYCSTDPYNMPELVGSILAVGIAYLVKFVLDKFVVFKKTQLEIKDTTQEFLKYFGFAIITTLLNIGIQFLMTNFLGTPLELSMIVALSIGYTVKFYFDRKYVFTK